MNPLMIDMAEVSILDADKTRRLQKSSIIYTSHKAPLTLASSRHRHVHDAAQPLSNTSNMSTQTSANLDHH